MRIQLYAKIKVREVINNNLSEIRGPRYQVRGISIGRTRLKWSHFLTKLCKIRAKH
jgi:hypothetical protein